MNEQRLPLVFALKHMQIVCDLDQLGSAANFSVLTRLMQGSGEIPAATDLTIDAALKQNCVGSLPEGIELQLLQMSCPGWPDDVVFAFAGITAFGAKDLDRAKTCAKHALSKNRNCKLARQLVRLLSARSDVRCPFGVDASKAPDVLRILSAEG